MNAVLEGWNQADERSATEAMLACCGSLRWAAKMVALRPFRNIVEFNEAADQIWAMMGEADLLEAFRSHPRIGEQKTASVPERSRAWSEQEQAGALAATQNFKIELAEGNAAYEQRFGFTFIVCATGKSAGEMLAILRRRLNNGRMAELKEAMEQQRQIMQIRLGKWLLS